MINNCQNSDLSIMINQNKSSSSTHLEEQESNGNGLELICDKCGRGFSKKSKLSRHVRESHLNIKNFPCTLCSKTFKRNSHLKRHMVSHSEEPKPFKCSKCTMQFACKHHLERHLKTLHADDFPFQCEICFLRFPKRASLFKHLTFIHNLQKPHKCCECDKDFFKNGQLMRHLKRIHPHSNLAHQQLACAQDYQLKQRIQATLALKNGTSKDNRTQTPQAPQQPVATATCYYYSLEDQIQILGEKVTPQANYESPSSSSSTSSTSSTCQVQYPSSNISQQQQCYRNMLEKYFGFDYDEEEDQENEESEDDYNINESYEPINDDVENCFTNEKSGLEKKEFNDLFLVAPLKKTKKISKGQRRTQKSNVDRSDMQDFRDDTFPQLACSEAFLLDDAQDHHLTLARSNNTQGINHNNSGYNYSNYRHVYENEALPVVLRGDCTDQEQQPLRVLQLQGDYRAAKATPSGAAVGAQQYQICNKQLTQHHYQPSQQEIQANKLSSDQFESYLLGPSLLYQTSSINISEGVEGNINHYSNHQNLHLHQGGRVEEVKFIFTC